MKKYNLLISAVLILAAYFFFVRQSPENSNLGGKGPEQNTPLENNADKSESGFIHPSRMIDKDAPIAPREIPFNELPEDIKRAASRTESNNPNDLPADLQEQLNAPPPELPEDLRRQLEMGPQELPEDLKAQLEGPPPPIPDDIKKALSIPPRFVTIDEVNNPQGQFGEERIE